MQQLVCTEPVASVAQEPMPGLSIIHCVLHLPQSQTDSYVAHSGIPASDATMTLFFSAQTLGLFMGSYKLQ